MNRYAIVELMGHVRHIGFVTEVEMFGAKLGQVDALNDDGTKTAHIFNAASIYQITPITEQQARNMVPIYAPALPAEPVQRCRICRCTDENCTGCLQRTGELCHWVEEDLCSACIGMVRCPGCVRGNPEEYDPWWRCPVCDNGNDDAGVISREQAEAYIAEHPEFAPYYDSNITDKTAMANEGEEAEAEQSSEASKPLMKVCPNSRPNADEYDPYKESGYRCKPECELCHGTAKVPA